MAREMKTKQFLFDMHMGYTYVLGKVINLVLENIRFDLIYQWDKDKSRKLWDAIPSTIFLGFAFIPYVFSMV
jgi:hypothetical protein